MENQTLTELFFLGLMAYGIFKSISSIILIMLIVRYYTKKQTITIRIKGAAGLISKFNKRRNTNNEH